MFTGELRPPLEDTFELPAEVLVPVYRAVSADTETPVSVFLKLRGRGTGFLLESAEQDGSLGRYSFIGFEPDELLRGELDRGTISGGNGTTPYRGAPLDALRGFVGRVRLHASPELPGFLGGAVGALGYDVVRTLEQIPAPDTAGPRMPAVLFGRYSSVVIFDHLEQRLLIVALMDADVDRASAYARAARRVNDTLDRLRRASPPPPFEGRDDDVDAEALLARASQHPGREEFVRRVGVAREYVRAGEAIQVVLSRQIDLPYDGDPFRIYRALRVLNPSPYMFFLEFPELSIVGASPEMLVRVEGDMVQVAPIAGTRPRGRDADEDAANERELIVDPKERAEHVMLVDLGRNDVGRVSRAGSVHVPRFMQVERYSHVMHIVSSVTGRLRSGVTPLDALATCFPAGTVTGAPKVRAMEIISELEGRGRGLYAGAVGYVGFGGAAVDSCIAIRTLLVRDGVAHLQTGAGIVADSDPERELAETDAKARAMLAALALAGAASSTQRPRLEEVTA